MKLAKLGNFYDEFDEEQKDLLDYLEPLNIEARYPSYKEALIKEFTKEKCLQILEKTEVLYKWVKVKL